MIYGFSLQDGHHLWIITSHRLQTILRRANLNDFLLKTTISPPVLRLRRRNLDRSISFVFNNY